jgi:enamine deaminase RidA (YjgF/YER057c/UK114 family)
VLRKRSLRHREREVVLKIVYPVISLRLSIAAIVLLFALGAQGQIRAVTPPSSTHADRLYSPGVDAGDYLYISAQGPAKLDGAVPPSFSEQVKQALENIEVVLQAASLSREHLVYVQVHMQDMGKYGELNKAFAEHFGKSQPARAVLGVARIPGSSIQINAVAVRSLEDKKPVYPQNYKADDSGPPGMLTHDRLFVSSLAGVDPATGKVPDDPASQVDLALDRMEAVLKAAGLDLKNMVFVNPYLTAQIPTRVMNERYARRFEFGNTPARATIQVSSLPGDAHIEYTGVAVRDLAQRKAVRPKNMPPSPTASPCVFAGDTLYCSAKDGFIPGAHGGIYATTTPHQLRQSMRNQLDNLEEAGMTFDQVVATNVYLDDLSDLPQFDEVYAQYFGPVLPARTMVQQIQSTQRKPDKDDHFPGLEQLSLIAVRKPAQ